jgi:hypothetical protein
MSASCCCRAPRFKGGRQQLRCHFKPKHDAPCRLAAVKIVHHAHKGLSSLLKVRLHGAQG